MGVDVCNVHIIVFGELEAQDLPDPSLGAHMLGAQQLLRHLW